MRTSLNQRSGDNPSGINKNEEPSDQKTYARSVNGPRAPAGRDERTPVNYTAPPPNTSKTTEVFRSNASSGPGSNPTSTFSPKTRVQAGKRK